MLFCRRLFNSVISLWQGSITTLEIDAIVNAANCTLLGGGGIDGVIHKASGYELKEECKKLKGCEIGEAKLTSGYKLPSKYVIHTVGPQVVHIDGPQHHEQKKLEECYENCLKLVHDNHIKSVAFCCISTGIYNYPNRDAAHIALSTVRKWLQQHRKDVDRIIFCTFLEDDYNIYQELMTMQYFRPKCDM